MMYSPAVSPCSSAAICVSLDLNHFVVGARPRGEYASASQYTLNVSTRPTSSAGQLSASTHLAAATPAPPPPTRGKPVDVFRAAGAPRRRSAARSGRRTPPPLRDCQEAERLFSSLASPLWALNSHKASHYISRNPLDPTRARVTR